MVKNWPTRKTAKWSDLVQKKRKKYGGTKEKSLGLIRFNNLQVIKGKEDGSAVMQWVNL